MAILNILPLLSFRNDLNGLSSVRLSLGNWRSGTNDSFVIMIVDNGWEREQN